MPSAVPTPPTSPIATPTLPEALRSLGLRRTAADLADFLARATRSRWSPAVCLEELVRAEAQDRARRSLERRLSRARLGRSSPWRTSSGTGPGPSTAPRWSASATSGSWQAAVT